MTVTDRRAYFGHPESWLDLEWGGLDAVDIFQCSYRDRFDGLGRGLPGIRAYLPGGALSPGAQASGISSSGTGR
ncbi:hypothetical protein CP975_09685 [Streptomyces alboniger]|uniref:Uncharacterized protein n=1 Tax=Streptomyces alboniger TaxID=132473 RepID=A0A5J6HGY9_STRAD|nr:hypothetical protein CP975_09685 [Streptomyces alboniger]